MADTKVSALVAATEATAADLLYLVDGATSKKVTFANLEAGTTHDNLIAGTIASHDTSATGTELDTLTDGSDSDALHAHAVNDAKVTNVSTNLSLGTLTATTIDVNSSDGTNATLIEADTINAGILGSDKWDEIVANSNKISYNSTASTKLGTIEESADVTDATNVVSSLSAATLTGALTAADHGTAATDQVVNICYGTGSPPTANTTTIGSLFVKYTA